MVSNSARWLAFALILAASACVHRAPGTVHESSSEPLTADQRQLRDELRRDVEALSVGIGPRSAQTLAKVLEAERWIIAELETAGITPRRDEIDLGSLAVANIEATFPGTSAADEIVLIGAHYDTVAGSPGANDNASGVALLLAAARRLTDLETQRSTRLVFFANEEPPLSFGMQMGSRLYAERARARGDDIVLMISVDSIGYYTDARGSQKGRPFLPSRGNFVAFGGNRENQALVDRVVALFQRHSRFPSLGLATDIKAINRSDHSSFWNQGYPAIFMSDTSEARDPHYHKPSDVADNLDYDQMARMAEGFLRFLQTLAAVETPL